MQYQTGLGVDAPEGSFDDLRNLAKVRGFTPAQFMDYFKLACDKAQNEVRLYLLSIGAKPGYPPASPSYALNVKTKVSLPASMVGVLKLHPEYMTQFPSQFESIKKSLEFFAANAPQFAASFSIMEKNDAVRAAAVQQTYSLASNVRKVSPYESLGPTRVVSGVPVKSNMFSHLASPIKFAGVAIAAYLALR